MQASIPTLLAVLALSILPNACLGWARKPNPPSSSPGIPTGADSLRYPDHLSFPVFLTPPRPMLEVEAISIPDRSGKVSSQRHHDAPEHGGEIHRSRPLSWKASIAPGRKVWGAYSSQGSQGQGSSLGEEARESRWVLWEEGDSLRALSESLQRPLSFPRPAKDVLIHPPILDVDGNLRLYHWRKTGKGYLLYRTSLPVAGGGAAKSTEVEIIAVEEEPLFTAAAPVLDSSFGAKPRENGEILGWLSSPGKSAADAGIGTRAHIVRIDGKGISFLASDTLGHHVPHPRQRLDIFGSRDGFSRLAFLVNRTGRDSSGLRLFLPRDQGARGLVPLGPSNLQTGKIHSAAILARRTADAEPALFILTPAGNLYWSWGNTLRKIREAVPLDYNFPMFASGLRIYEARFDKNGGIFLNSAP